MPASLLTRDELLARLCETFTRFGYEGASMTRVAAATGLGKASLYHHFPGGKEEMAAAVLTYVRDWFEQNVFRPLEGVSPPRQRLTSMLDVVAGKFESGRKACLPALFALTEERALFGSDIDGFFTRWINCLTQTMADAGLARDIAERRAHDALARIQGALVLARAFDDAKPYTIMASELPAQLLAGGDRSDAWSTRSPRYPVQPAAVPFTFATSSPANTRVTVRT